VNRRRTSPVRVRPQPGAPDIRSAFGRELARSRRFGRSVAVFAAPVARGDAQQQLLGTLELHLRRYDLTASLDVGRPERAVVVIITPDTHPDEARTVLDRLDQVLIGSDARSLGLAMAPEDGEVLDDLVQIALERFISMRGGVS